MVGIWLEELKLQSLKEIFEKEEIDGRALVALIVEDFSHLGLNAGQKSKVRTAIATVPQGSVTKIKEKPGGANTKDFHVTQKSGVSYIAGGKQVIHVHGQKN